MSRLVPLESQFDRLIASSLSAKAEQVKPSPDLASQVGQMLRTGGARRKPPAWSLGWKRTVAAAACVALVGLGTFMAASPGAQAWASDVVDLFVNHMQGIYEHHVAKNGSEIGSLTWKFTDTGDQSVKRVPIDPNQEKTGFVASVVATREQAEQRAGFPVKLPSYLPAGLQLTKDGIEVLNVVHQIGRDSQPVATGEYQVMVSFANPDQDPAASRGLFLRIAPSTEGDFMQGSKYVDAEMGGQPARWFDLDMNVTGVSSSGQTQAVTEHERALSWTAGGLNYLLFDNSGALPQTEMVKIAESLK